MFSRSSLAALISNFEPDVLEPDRCKVELKMEASTAYLYGSLIRSFMHVKEVSVNKLNSFCKVRFYVYSRVSAEFFKITFSEMMYHLENKCYYFPSEYHVLFS